MNKIDFKLSSNTYTYVNRYAKSLNLPIQTIIKFLLVESLHQFEFSTEDFMEKYRQCKPKELFGTKDIYGNDKPPHPYTIEFSEYIYDGIVGIKKQTNDKTEIIVNNLLHLRIKEKMYNFDSEFATLYKELAPNTKQYSIPLSSQFTTRLQTISEITGIKVNQLMSLIIGNYLIEHYTDYDNGVYMNPETGKYYHGIW